jgi:hypothetical protein
MEQLTALDAMFLHQELANAPMHTHWAVDDL